MFGCKSIIEDEGGHFCPHRDLTGEIAVSGGRTKNVSTAVEVEYRGAVDGVCRSAPPSRHSADGRRPVIDFLGSGCLQHLLIEEGTRRWSKFHSRMQAEFRAQSLHDGMIRRVFVVVNHVRFATPLLLFCLTVIDILRAPCFDCTS